MTAAPPIVPRPAFAQWLFERALDYSQAAAALETSRETIRKVCLPFSDPRRRAPYGALMRRIIAWTGGEVTADSFYAADMDLAA